MSPTEKPANPELHLPTPGSLGAEADSDFEKEAEEAETEEALDRDLEQTFPTSDPSSSWAGPDIEPEQPQGEQPSQDAASEHGEDDEPLDEHPIPSEGAPSGVTGLVVGKPDVSTR